MQEGRESALVTEWIEEGSRKKVLDALRDALLSLLRTRFPGAVNQEIVDTITSQPSQKLLSDWITQTGSVSSIEDFVAYLRR
jgi:hypothetical protein